MVFFWSCQPFNKSQVQSNDAVKLKCLFQVNVHMSEYLAFPVIVFKSLSTCLFNEFNRSQALFAMPLHANYNVCLLFYHYRNG